MVSLWSRLWSFRSLNSSHHYKKIRTKVMAATVNTSSYLEVVVRMPISSGSSDAVNACLATDLAWSCFPMDWQAFALDFHHRRMTSSDELDHPLQVQVFEPAADAASCDFEAFEIWSWLATFGTMEITLPSSDSATSLPGYLWTHSTSVTAATTIEPKRHLSKTYCLSKKAAAACLHYVRVCSKLSYY